MNKIKGLLLILMLGLYIATIPGCEEIVETPEEIDLNSRTPDLSSMYRIPLEANVPGLDYFEGNQKSIDRAKENRSVLRPVIAEIVSDVLSGDLPVYLPEERTPLSAEARFRSINLMERTETGNLKGEEGYQAGMEALANTVEVEYGFYKTPGGVIHKVQAVRLVWRDLNEILPELNFGVVLAKDLIGKGYQVQNGEKATDLISFLEEGDLEMYPITLYHGTDHQMGMRTLEQAYFEKEKLESGNF